MEARLDAGLSRRDLSRAVGVDTAKVRAWERSDKVPTGVDLGAIADACGVSVDVLVPPRQPLWFDPVHGRLVVGEQEVRIDPSVIGNEGVLRCYLSMVRFERGLEPNAPVTLRLDDLEVLALALDVTDRQLEEQLVTLAGVSEQNAADIRRRLVRRRAPTRVAALAIGVLSAVPVVQLKTATHHADVPTTPRPTGVGADAPVEIGEALTIERGNAQP
jgi:transcriptional regulator with XRE-family HTH domain